MLSMIMFQKLIKMRCYHVKGLMQLQLYVGDSSLAIFPGIEQWPILRDHKRLQRQVVEERFYCSDVCQAGLSFNLTLSFKYYLNIQGYS